MITSQKILDGNYSNASFAQWDLAEAVLSGKFIDVDFRNANLTGAKLTGTFVNVNFTGATTAGVDTSDGSFVNVVPPLPWRS